MDVQSRISLAKYRFDRRFSVSRYSSNDSTDSGDEHWITIGGGEEEGGGKHVGGTHVKIDGNGNIVAGPDAIAKKGIKRLSDFGGESKPDSDHSKPESEPEPKPTEKPEEIHEKSKPYVELAKSHGRELRAGEPRRYVEFVGHGKRNQVEGRGPQIGEIHDHKDGPWMVAEAEKPGFVSDDWIEDMDAWHQFPDGPGWYVRMTKVPVKATDEETNLKTVRESKKQSKERIKEIGSQVRNVENLIERFPQGESFSELKNYGHRSGAGSDTLHSNGKSLVMCVSSYDDGPWYWRLDDESLAKEALELDEKASAPEPTITRKAPEAKPSQSPPKPTATEKPKAATKNPEKSESSSNRHLELVKSKVQSKSPLSFSGNTYAHKDTIKRIGEKVGAFARWDPTNKVWRIHPHYAKPEHHETLAAELKKLEEKGVNAYSRIALAKARYKRSADDQMIERYSWDESKHPRGQPSNKGEFAKAPGGGGTSGTNGGTSGTKTAASGIAQRHGDQKTAANQPKTGDSVQVSPASPENRIESAKANSGVAAQLAKSPPATQKAINDLGPLQEKSTAPPPGGYNPNPASGKAARVGVPGMVVPPPPSKIPRLNNLNPEERQVEDSFAKQFEANPDGMADKMIQEMAKGMGDGPNIFATDEAKGLFKQWEGTKLKDAQGNLVLDKDGKPQLSNETKEFRSKYNTALHQTANALAKRAFLKYLDTVVSQMPPEKKHVVVTAGGVAAGKGFAIKNVSKVKSISQLAAATWDSAGEQNSTELPWLAQECKKRGIKMTAVFVHSNPTETWENPQRGVVQRAANIGRMVDARPFADSYTYGAQNFHKFAQENAGNQNVQTFVLDNTRPWIPDLDENGVQRIDEKGKPKLKPDVQEIPQIPDEMLKMSPENLFNRCLQTLDTAPVPKAVKEGGSAGVRIWGPPKISQKSAV